MSTALKLIGKGVSLFEIDADELIKNIDPDLLKNVDFQKQIQNFLKLKDPLSKLNPRDKNILIDQELSKIAENEKLLNTPGFGFGLRTFLKNSGIVTKRIYENIFTPSHIKGSSNVKGVGGRNLSPIAKQNILEKQKIFNKKYRGEDQILKRKETMDKLPASKLQQMSKDRQLALYKREGGSREKYLRIAELMKENDMGIVEATNTMLKEFGLSPSASTTFYSFGGKQSQWLYASPVMKKQDPELFKFLNNKITDYNIKKSEQSKLLDQYYADRNLYKKVNPRLSKILTALRGKNIFTDAPYEPGSIEQEHVLGKIDMRKMSEAAEEFPFLKKRLETYREPKYLTTRERNQLKNILYKKIDNVLGEKELLQNSYDQGNISQEEFITNMATKNARLNMLNSELVDQGLNLIYFNPKTNEEMFFGKQYSNLGQLLTSEKKGIVPQPVDTVGPPKPLKTPQEVKELKQGGLLNIEEVLNSD